MFFMLGRRARNIKIFENIFDEAELFKMNFMALFGLHIVDVNPHEVFNVAFVFEKKFIRQAGNGVINDFVVFGKDAAVISAEANDCIFSDEKAWVCFARNKAFGLETL